jgi:hypothetical protein
LPSQRPLAVHHFGSSHISYDSGRNYQVDSIQKLADSYPL